jgi:hypothetical protein
MHTADVVTVITVKLTNMMMRHLHSQQKYCDQYSNNWFCMLKHFLWIRFHTLALRYTWCVQEVSNLWSAEIHLLI